MRQELFSWAFPFLYFFVISNLMIKTFENEKSRSDFSKRDFYYKKQQAITLASSLGFQYIVSKFARTELRLHRR